MFETVLTDLRGAPISDLQGAKEREFAMPLRSMATGKLVVALDHDDADALLDCKTLLKVYETLDDDESVAAALAGRRTTNGDLMAGPTVVGIGGQPRVLHFVGRQITGEESATAGTKPTVAATFADPIWTLTRRLIGRSATGYAYGTAAAPVNIGQIVDDILAVLSDLDENDIPTDPTGVDSGSIIAGAEADKTYVSGWHYKPAAEAIAEVCATLGGPDWRVRPIEPILELSTHPLARIGEVDLAPTIGVPRPDAAYEYGDGLLNVAAYRRVVSLEATAADVWSVIPSDPLRTMVESSPATRNAYGMLEHVVQSDINVDDLRRKLLQHHIEVRSLLPRQIITFDAIRDPTGRRVPRIGIDVDLGDTFPFRASLRRRGRLVKRIDVTMRCYQAAIKIDDEGTATTQLTTTPEA